MTQNWRLYFYLVLTLELFVGCNYTRFKNADSDFTHTPVLNKTEQDTIGFQQVFREVIKPYCISCHTSGPFPLNNYTETHALLDKIRTSVFVTGTMPKFKALPSRERSVLLAWLDAGAPEQGKSSQAEPEIPPLEPTFSSIRDRIFQTRCGDCHEPKSQTCLSSMPLDDQANGNQSACKIELSDYNELLYGDEETRKELVIPGNPDESQLVISIERTDGKDQMPPPDQGYGPLTPEEIKAIRDWISTGALNN